MLERFRVPFKDAIRVQEASLRDTVTAIFEAVGVSTEDALEGADVLVMTDLRGVETHGVSNMLRQYVKSYNEGTLNPRPKWRITREAPATATIDADRGLVVILGPMAMRVAMAKARKVGVGVVTMFNAGHSGAIGHYAMLAAREGMVGVCMTAPGPRVVPTFGAEPRLGTNPIAIAAPAGNEPYVLFDAATSALAGNKVGLAARVGATLLPGWIANNEGVPIVEETPVPGKGQFHHLPVGGTREGGSHKGYGFGLMAEILSTMLSDTLPMMLDPDVGSHHYFAAYDINSFTNPDDFKKNMDRMLKKLRETKPAPGQDRVIYPGLIEHEEEQERRANGIPLHKEVVQWFDHITTEFSIPTLKRT